MLALSPLLLGCGTWGELWIRGNDESTVALLTICDPEDESSSKIPSCQELQARLENGETLVVREGWFNFWLALEDSWWDSGQLRSPLGDKTLVSRIIPGSNQQWMVEVWLLEDNELRPIADVFPYGSEELWQILEWSIFSDASYSEEVIAASVGIPVDGESEVDHNRSPTDELSNSQILLELFNANHLIFTGTLETHVRITRSCTAGLEAVFGQELLID
ncbi:MAG: hypothetical protein ACPGVO_23070 [Spirulinaceae cyanobacterium]